jgi:hypothetical protein
MADGRRRQRDQNTGVMSEPYQPNRWEKITKAAEAHLGTTITVAIAAVALAACARGAPPLSPEELAFRAATAERGDELDRAMFCGADPARAIESARQDPIPASIAPAFARSYRELLVARLEVTKNLRGSNGDNPDCLALRSRPDLARLWPAPATVRPASRPLRSLPPPPLTNPSVQQPG